jgi:hypothetical protein
MERIIMDRIMKKHAGVTLIELCIAMVIISFTGLIICAFSKSTLGMNKDALCNDTAYLAAEQIIVKLKKKVYNQNQIPVNSSDNITLENINFTRNWKIDWSGYLLLATVTVEWNSPSGTRKITLEGLVN